MITLKLTPIQAKVVFNTLDGQGDAGACEGGNTKTEARAIEDVMTKLLKHHDDWRGADIIK